MHRRMGLGGLVVALVLGAGAAGCGSGSDSQLTKAELARQANAICKRVEAQSARAMSTLIATAKKNIPKSQAAKHALAVKISSARRTGGRQINDALAALDPPSELEASYRRYLAFRRQRTALEPSGQEILSGENSHHDEASAAAEGATRIAKRIGLTVCL